ncbi:hypothetical protein K9L97_01525 [Candidatus Woesearchaeota archaeon]|nr:hypothetical protein [Candidatus Woesearchaeota archaeon]
MVKIDKGEFNRDMDDYLNSRKGESQSSMRSGALKLFSFFQRRIPNDEEIEMRAREREVENVRELENMQDDVEDIQAAEDAMELEREGIFKRFLKLLRLGGRSDFPEEEEVLESVAEQKALELEESFKDTVKMLHKWLEMLPAEKMDQFKRSDDFQRYKEVLKKLGMIKN